MKAKDHFAVFMAAILMGLSADLIATGFDFPTSARIGLCLIATYFGIVLEHILWAVSQGGRR